MATIRGNIILLVATIAALFTSVSAKVFVVGDDKGWTLNFDYQAWAYGKEFVVGDKLVFKYAAGKHNVFSVNGTIFQQCMIPPTNEALTSGYDVVTLATPGRKWYICGVGKHCEMGLKLFINVLPQSMPPTPSTPSAPSSKVFIVGDTYGWTLNFDYQAWAMGKEFVVGDKLVFRYPMGKHNVIRVNGTTFQQCTIPSTNEALTSGYDVVTLATPGRKWYICGIGKHCEMGLKLFINVLSQSVPPTPSTPPTPSSKVFIVGDNYGWTLNFDYQAWAMGKEFIVGDKLVFRYPVGKHNVFRVNGTTFQQCTIPPTNAALTSGYDVVTLATPGRKWYICGVGKHCEMGLKLFINVLPRSVPPTPSTPSAPSSKVFVIGDNYGWTLNFDYQAWAMGKEFVVGDKLVFRYLVGKHNVFRVNGTTFQQCTIPPTNEALTSGYDVVTLVTPGRKWYICGVGKHCEMGLKLFINVLPYPTYSPPPYHRLRKLAPPKF